MRPDMDKVLVERPRHGSSDPTPDDRLPWRSVPVEDWPTRGRMGRTTKRLNENLAPLCRFLRSRVGYPWDKVFGELSARINRRHAVQAHILQHLYHYVAVNTTAIDGRLVLIDHRGRIYQRWLQPDFYVDPRSGLLRVWEPRRALGSHRLTLPVFTRLDEDRYHAQFNGVWFELRVAPLRDDPMGCYDAALRRVIVKTSRKTAIAQRHYGTEVYAISKRSLNTKEIKAFGLRGAAMPLPNIVR